MTPGARVAAAIEVLDMIGAGTPAEKALTNWARARRFAGSKDRAAIRDLVFSAIRCRASFAALGGGMSGRNLMLGSFSGDVQGAKLVFTGEGYAPAELSEDEVQLLATPRTLDRADEFDVPAWLLAELDRSLGDAADPILTALKTRAPLHLRVNLGKSDRATAQQMLATDDISSDAHPLVETGLVVTRNPRRVRQSSAFAQGLVELQDASSQLLISALPLGAGMRVLDLCAGGGGKALGIAARDDVEVYVHDIDPKRMQDIPERARRAGVRLHPLSTKELPDAAPFDLVLADVPCSGSGAWRRAPEGKWTLTEDRLSELNTLQDAILRQAAGLTKPSGNIVYSTCSLFQRENSDRVQKFCAENNEWKVKTEKQLSPLLDCDGFYFAILGN